MLGSLPAHEYSHPTFIDDDELDLLPDIRDSLGEVKCLGVLEFC